MPERLALVCGELLHGSASGQLILTFGDTEALLLELDALSGLPPGQALEGAGRAFALRTLAKSDAFGGRATEAERLRHLADELMSEFVGDPLKLHLDSGSPNKLELSLTIFGRPRMARLLRHFVEGVARAALLRRRSGGTPTIAGTVSGDRATVMVSYDPSGHGHAVQPSRRRPSSAALRSPTTTRVSTKGLSQQIDAILSSRQGKRRRQDENE